MANVVDTLRVAALAQPGPAALAAMRHLVTRSSLRRGPADIYRLHDQFVGAMTKDEARRLIALEARLDRAAPKGQQVVSDVFSGS